MAAGQNSNAVMKLTERDGRALAIDLIRELVRDSKAASACAIEPALRGDKPQHNVVLDRLDALAGHRAAVVGFASILSEYISSAAQGCVEDVDYLAEFIDVPG